MSIPQEAQGVGSEIAAPVARLHPVAAPAARPPSADEQLRLHLDPNKALIVPVGVRIRGDIEADSLFLAGEVVGNVKVGTGHLVVAPTGDLLGSIDSQGAVVIAGKVGGDGAKVRTPGEVDLAETARVTADIEYESITIRNGAEIDGRVSKYRA